jgi:hypothetical protein
MSEIPAMPEAVAEIHQALRGKTLSPEKQIEWRERLYSAARDTLRNSKQHGEQLKTIEAQRKTHFPDSGLVPTTLEQDALIWHVKQTYPDYRGRVGKQPIDPAAAPTEKQLNAAQTLLRDGGAVPYIGDQFLQHLGVPVPEELMSQATQFLHANRHMPSGRSVDTGPSYS